MALSDKHEQSLSGLPTHLISYFEIKMAIECPAHYSGNRINCLSLSSYRDQANWCSGKEEITHFRLRTRKADDK